jgi:hypothetical protein
MAKRALGHALKETSVSQRSLPSCIWPQVWPGWAIEDAVGLGGLHGSLDASCGNTFQVGKWPVLITLFILSLFVAKTMYGRTIPRLLSERSSKF